MQHARPIGPTAVNAQATFEPSMVQGSHPPEQSRFYSPVNRQGLSLSQTTHVPSPLQPAMTQGHQPPELRYIAPQHQGWLGQAPDVAVVVTVSFEQGSQPPEQRYTAPFHQGWSVSQTTHDQATFGPEMVAGAQPQKNRAFTYPKLGWTSSQTTHDAAAFSVEMAAGSSSLPRYIAPKHTGWFGQTTEVVSTTFSSDSVIGWHPDKPKIQLGPRIGLPVSQTTHVAAPFSTEMAQGTVPAAKFRGYVAKKLGWSIVAFPLEVAVVEVSGRHRYTVPSHLRGMQVSAHVRTQTTTAHQRTFTVGAHRRSFTVPNRKRDE